MPKKNTKKRSKSMKKKDKAAKVPENLVKVSVKKKILGQAPQEFSFYLADGRKLKSLLELVDSLEDMSDDLFRQHVNPEKNDFSSWIKDVFEEKDLADEIQKVSNKVETQVKILHHIVDRIMKEG